MIQNPHDKVTLTQMTDQAFRANTPHRAVDQLVHILDVQGIPRFFTPVDRVLLKGFQSFGGLPAGRRRAAGQGEDAPRNGQRDLARRAGVCWSTICSNRRREGSADECELSWEKRCSARRRRKTGCGGICRPCSCRRSRSFRSRFRRSIRRFLRWPVSTRSTCCPIAWSCLFRAAAKATFQRADGTVVPKFVYLDMEEYRDMSLTATPSCGPWIVQDWTTWRPGLSCKPTFPIRIARSKS